MREKIYTIPVHDAYRQTDSCPLCTLENSLTDELVAYYLGPSLMEPDVRITTNEHGFCHDHWRALYRSENNRLGLGLILHTHLGDITDDIRQTAAQLAPSLPKGLFSSRQKDYRQQLNELADSIEQRVNRCVLCDQLDQTMSHYLDVICHEYFHDPDFKCHFNAGQGYCLPHLALLLRSAARFLGPAQAVEFVQALNTMQNQSLETLRDDVEWFTLKFDYRHAKDDWKNSKDALPRAIRKLTGPTDL